ALHGALPIGGDCGRNAGEDVRGAAALRTSRHSLAPAPALAPARGGVAVRGMRLLHREPLDHPVHEVGLAVLAVRQEADERVLAGCQLYREVVGVALRERGDAADARTRRRPVLGREPPLEVLDRLAGLEAEELDLVPLRRV